MGCLWVRLTVITSGGSHSVVFEVCEGAVVDAARVMRSSMHVLLALLGHSTML